MRSISCWVLSRYSELFAENNGNHYNIVFHILYYSVFKEYSVSYIIYYGYHYNIVFLNYIIVFILL